MTDLWVPCWLNDGSSLMHPLMLILIFSILLKAQIQLLNVSLLFAQLAVPYQGAEWQNVCFFPRIRTSTSPPFCDSSSLTAPLLQAADDTLIPVATPCLKLQIGPFKYQF